MGGCVSVHISVHTSDNVKVFYSHYWDYVYIGCSFRCQSVPEAPLSSLPDGSVGSWSIDLGHPYALRRRLVVSWADSFLNSSCCCRWHPCLVIPAIITRDKANSLTATDMMATT